MNEPRSHDPHERQALYLEKAREAEEVAARVKEFQARDLILQIAQSWRILARQTSRSE